MLEAFCDRCKKKFTSGFRLMLVPEEYSIRGIITHAMDMSVPHDKQLCKNCREDLEAWLHPMIRDIREPVMMPCPRCSGSATMFSSEQLKEHLSNVHGENSSQSTNDDYYPHF